MITNADICRSLHAYQLTRVVSEGGIMCLKGGREGGKEGGREGGEGALLHFIGFTVSMCRLLLLYILRVCSGLTILLHVMLTVKKYSCIC